MRFFHTFLGSFYSDATYREARLSPGHGLSYSLLLVMITTLIFVLYGVVAFHRVLFTPYHTAVPVFDDAVTQVVNQLPVMTLKDHTLVTKEPRATTIHLDVHVMDRHWAGDVATIDTTGKSDYNTMKTPMLITAHELITKSDKETKIKSYRDLRSSNDTIILDHAMAQALGSEVIDIVHSHLMQFYLVTGLFIWLVIIAVAYMARLCMLVALALGGLILGGFLNSPLRFDGGMRLAAVSFTPLVVLHLLAILVFGHVIGTLWLFLGGLALLGTAIYVTRDTVVAAPV